MESFFPAPALLQQGVTHDAGGALKTRVEVEGDVCPWPRAAATGQVHLEPDQSPA